LQAPQLASAREYREQCADEIRQFPDSKPVLKYNNGNNESNGTYYDSSNVRYSSQVVNVCRKEQTIGVVAGFDKGSTSIGLVLNSKFNSFITTRTLALYKEKSIEIAAALTTEVTLGPADIFLGGGYNYNFSKTTSNYPYLTTGVDLRITPQLDLNATIRIPVSGGSDNSVNYLAGLNLTF
jgi:hypothetical protein